VSSIFRDNNKEGIMFRQTLGQAGTAYSAIPEVKNGKPIVVVKLATADGQSHSVAVDLK